LASESVHDTCVIFDLDGTLVDSEPLCNRAFLDLLPELDDTVEGLVRRYRGSRMAPVLEDLERRLGRRLPADFESVLRRRVAELFDEHLQVMPGALEMLAQLDCAMCIASSGPMQKIRHSLRLSGLAPWFGERVFSAYDVGSWKPDPGLFLHAANAMGFAPAQCIVVEDSEPGLLAARAAGMRVVHFSPSGEATVARADVRVTDLAEVPAYIAGARRCTTP
jgi:HAD superfamily hydrolase (TIGR01509 family)